jgi:hypothetical protein
MVLANDLTWVLGTTGVLINDAAVPPFIDVAQAKGFDSAPFRTTERDREGYEGGYMDAEFEKGRDIVITGTIYGDPASVESYLDLLKANWAPSSTLQQLFFKAPGVNERFLWVKPLGCKYDWTTERRWGSIDIQLGAYAEDPRIYDNSLHTVTIGLGATVFTGFGFPLGFSFGFGGVSITTDVAVVDVDGDRPTPPVFTITGPVTDPRILNDDTGVEMKFSGIVLADNTQTLVVDVKNRTVKLNGTTNRRNTLVAPTWFDLQEGVNHLRFRAGSSDPTAQLQTAYYPAWR